MPRSDVGAHELERAVDVMDRQVEEAPHEAVPQRRVQPPHERVAARRAPAYDRRRPRAPAGRSSASWPRSNCRSASVSSTQGMRAAPDRCEAPRRSRGCARARPRERADRPPRTPARSCRLRRSIRRPRRLPRTPARTSPPPLRPHGSPQRRCLPRRSTAARSTRPPAAPPQQAAQHRLASDDRRTAVASPEPKPSRHRAFHSSTVPPRSCQVPEHRCGGPSAQDAGVPDRVAAGLRPDGTARAGRCRPGCGAAAGRCACRSRRPRRCSGRVSHSTRPSADTPPMSGEPPPGMRHLRSGGAVRNEITLIEPSPRLETYSVLRVAARVEAVRAARRSAAKRITRQRARVDQPDAVGRHVGDVERAPVGRELDVLRHRAGLQRDRAHARARGRRSTTIMRPPNSHETSA